MLHSQNKIKFKALVLQSLNKMKPSLTKPFLLVNRNHSSWIKSEFQLADEYKADKLFNQEEKSTFLKSVWWHLVLILLLWIVFFTVTQSLKTKQKPNKCKKSIHKLNTTFFSINFLKEYSINFKPRNISMKTTRKIFCT